MKSKKILLGGLAIFAAVSVTALAINVQNHRYYFHSGRTDTLVESKPLPADTLTFSFTTNVSLDPFEFGNSAGALPGQSIVSLLTTFDFGVDYSFSDRLAVSVNMPLHASSNAISLANLTKQTSFGIGDVMIAGHLNILDGDNNNLGFGLGVVPFLSLPTGSSSNFVGDSTITGGALAAVDMNFAGDNYVGANVGFRFRGTENLVNLSVAHELLYSLAYHRPIIADQELNGFVELQGSTVLKDAFVQANSSPLELKLGVSKVVNVLSDKPLEFKLVNGVGLSTGYGNPDYRGTLQVTYAHSLKKTEVVEKTVTVSRVERVEQRLKELTIYYPTDGSQVDPFYEQKIEGIARVMRENPDLYPLYIIGHTDDVGSDGYNQKLSERRARQAFESIVKYGLDDKNVVYVGMGENHSIVANDSDDNRALNRRTVFTFQKPTYLMEGMGNYSGERYKSDGKHADSYTEKLRMQQAQGLPEQNVKYDETRVEDVKVEEKVETKKPNKVPDPLKESDLREESTDEDDADDLEEPFAD